MSAKVHLLVFLLDECRYGLHLFRVQRVVRAVEITPLPGAPEIVFGAFSLRGTIVPALNIRQRFGLSSHPIGVDDQFIIARAGKRTVALVVDNVIGIVERAATEIVGSDKVLPHLSHVEGIIPLQEDLVLIHDLDKFLSLEEQSTLDRALSEQQPHDKQ